MDHHHPSLPIHEATFLASGKVIDQDRLCPTDLDAAWVQFFHDLLAQGGGTMDAPIGHWRLIVQHDSGSMGLVSLAIHDRCLCSLLFLTGHDIPGERALIYRFLHHLSMGRKPQDSIPIEPNFELLSIRQRPLLAVVVFEGFDTMSSALALDISTFLGAAWFDLHTT
jgi:hypothetical protein